MNILNTMWFWVFTGVIWGLTIMLSAYSIVKYLLIESFKLLLQ